MKAKYYLGAYYLLSDVQQVVYKVTPIEGAGLSIIEVVDAMPQLGVEMDAADTVVQAALDNVRQNVNMLIHEAANPNPSFL